MANNSRVDVTESDGVAESISFSLMCIMDCSRIALSVVVVFKAREAYYNRMVTTKRGWNNKLKKNAYFFAALLATVKI